MSNNLSHHGILGQKWGVRRTPEQLGHRTGSSRKNTSAITKTEQAESGNALIKVQSKTKNNVTVTIGEEPTAKFTQFVSKIFPSAKDQILRDKQFNVDVDGKRVGDVEIFKESEDSLNVVWVSVNKSERGKGYGGAIMDCVIKFAKQEGFKQITLEVPGSSPDARHIYEKKRICSY